MPHTIYNSDLKGIISRCQRFYIELNKSQSSNVSATNQFDIERMVANIAAARAFVGWVTSTPQLDLPESTPKAIAFPTLKELSDGMEDGPMTEPENEAISDMCRMWELMEIELCNSQSARLGSSIFAPDQRRIVAILDKMDAFVENYIKKVQPLDLPESVPMEQDTGSGFLGINQRDGGS